jgi:hypothetical protein
MNNRSETILKYLLIGISVVAVATGANIIVQGISGIPETGLIVQASVDNELRFMSVFWLAFGLFCFAISKNVVENQKSISYIALTFLCGGIARLLSLVFIGQPIGLFIGVMILELVLPFFIFALLKGLSNKPGR